MKRESKFHRKISISFKKTLYLFSVHLKQEEKVTVRCGRDGGLENLEVHGMIMLRVKSEQSGRILVAVNNKETRNIQLQVNLKKKLCRHLLIFKLIFIDSSKY